MSENWGIKISLPGIDVTKATPEQCVIHSQYDTHKINDHASPAHYGVIHVTVQNEPATNSTTNVLKINHGYTYRPASFVHINDPLQGSSPYGLTGSYFIGGGNFLNAYTTGTQFRVDLVKGGFGVPMVGEQFTIRYYLFAEEAT